MWSVPENLKQNQPAFCQGVLLCVRGLSKLLHLQRHAVVILSSSAFLRNLGDDSFALLLIEKNLRSPGFRNKQNQQLYIDRLQGTQLTSSPVPEIKTILITAHRLSILSTRWLNVFIVCATKKCSHRWVRMMVGSWSGRVLNLETMLCSQANKHNSDT